MCRNVKREEIKYIFPFKFVDIPPSPMKSHPYPRSEMYSLIIKVFLVIIIAMIFVVIALF